MAVAFDLNKYSTNSWNKLSFYTTLFFFFFTANYIIVYCNVGLWNSTQTVRCSRISLETRTPERAVQHPSFLRLNADVLWPAGEIVYIEALGTGECQYWYTHRGTNTLSLLAPELTIRWWRSSVFSLMLSAYGLLFFMICLQPNYGLMVMLSFVLYFCIRCNFFLADSTVKNIYCKNIKSLPRSSNS